MTIVIKFYSLDKPYPTYLFIQGVGIVGKIKIYIGCEIVAVRMNGVTIHPRKNNIVKETVSEFHKNNYFRRKTISFFGVKAAEIALRSFSAHQLYLLCREHLLPYVPTIISFIRSQDWIGMALCVDAGFMIGVITSITTVQLKKYFWKAEKK